jgi:hypothetical protein
MGSIGKYHNVRGHAHCPCHRLVRSRCRITMCIYERACQELAHNGRAYHGFWLGRHRRYISLPACDLLIVDHHGSGHESTVPTAQLHFISVHYCLFDPYGPCYMCRYHASVPPIVNSEGCISKVCFCFTGGKFAIKHVPVKIRHILSAESAANDGLAYPFLSISIYLTVEASVKSAIGKWFLVGWLCLCRWFFGTCRHSSFPHRPSYPWHCFGCRSRSAKVVRPFDRICLIVLIAQAFFSPSS